MLSVATTDLSSSLFSGETMRLFAERYPDTELRCGPSEDADVLYLIQEGLADIGVLAAQPNYPPQIISARLPECSEFALFASRHHPLANMASIERETLERERRLYIKTYAPSIRDGRGRAWSAPDYLTLIEFALAGFGWAELPRHLVRRFGHSLVELQFSGYPRSVAIDVAWSRGRTLGPAGQWLIEQLQSKPAR